jgi:hypothetical protein
VTVKAEGSVTLFGRNFLTMLDGFREGELEFRQISSLLISMGYLTRKDMVWLRLVSKDNKDDDGYRNAIIKEYLTQYKHKVLKIEQDGIWKRKNKQYGHILPETHRNKNILPSEYHQAIVNEIVQKGIRLHTDFHHLNSSQALCLNLFYPVINKSQFLTILKSAIELDNKKGECLQSYEFEYVENKKEKTNFDLVVLTNLQKYYFEVKYTEDEFGKARNDANHIKKYNSYYKDKLKAFNNVDIKTFFKYYQIFRNILYNDGYNIFVLPENRADLIRDVNKIKEQYCTNEQRGKIIVLTIENIVNSIIANINDKGVQDHYGLFKNKYLIK